MTGNIFINKMPKMTSVPLNPNVNYRNDISSRTSTLFDVGPPEPWR